MCVCVCVSVHILANIDIQMHDDIHTNPYTLALESIVMITQVKHSSAGLQAQPPRWNQS